MLKRKRDVGMYRQRDPISGQEEPCRECLHGDKAEIDEDQILNQSDAGSSRFAGVRWSC